MSGLVVKPGMPSLARISVVLCTYQGARFLSQQLATLITQTQPIDELIVCDDCSDDDTVEILYKFQRSAPFPVHISVNPLNLGSTRNFDQALQLATGDYLALCDQDDLWFPDKLESLAEVLDKHADIAGVFSDAVLATADVPDTTVRAPTLWTTHHFDRMKQEKFIQGGQVDLLLQHDIVTGATLMVRASARPVWHPIPASWIHDAWIAWMLAIHLRLSVVPRPLMAYRVHAEQQVGLGKMSAARRLRQLRNTERARYARLADNFELLRERVEASRPFDARLLALLESKIAMLRRRAALPRHLAGRVAQIAADLPNYRQYARGWRSARKDLLLF